jgi:PBSX family phage terminase large subunit
LNQQAARLKVNNAYIPLFGIQSRYLVLWGGSGSGKSVYASQKIVTRLITENRHRFLCIRKVATTLRSSVYQRFFDLIHDLGLLSEFDINKTEMRFTHRPTGNEILMVGLDDVEKLKSIEGITGVWVEEATELNESDFDQIDLRLRGETLNYKQIILSFNPIDESHWLKKRFFDSAPENAYTLRTTFKDNHFIDDEYRRVLEQKASVSPNLYRIYYLGEWGKEDIESPYCYNFKREKHISDRAIYNPLLPVHFSIDFNVEPFICIASHKWIDSKGYHAHYFKEFVIEKNGDVYKMIDLIKGTFDLRALSMCLFTGDAMQRKREITQRNNIDAWRIIDQQLNLGRRLLVPKSNPSVKENRHLVNAVLAFHPDIIINPECKKLIYDMQFVEADADGDIIKKNRNKEEQRADALDCFRYDINTHLRNFIETYKIK